MRIAVCVSGESRTFSTAIHGIKKFFGENVDYFAHTWSSNTWAVYENNEKKSVTEELDVKQLHSDIFRMLNPVRYRVEKQLDFQHVTSMAQQYSMLSANTLKSIHEMEMGFTYDIVVRCRWDIIWEPHASFNVDEIDPETLYATYVDTQQSTYPMLLDRFFFGSSHVMDIATNLFKYTKIQHAKGIDAEALDPEKMFHIYMKERNIDIALHGLFETIVRQEATHLHHSRDFFSIKMLEQSFHKKALGALHANSI